jgi:hypothetical protein
MAGSPGINATDQQIAVRRPGRSLPKSLRYRFPGEAPEHIYAPHQAHGFVQSDIDMGKGLTHCVHLGHNVWVHDSNGETWLTPGAQGLLQEGELKQDCTSAPACANEQDAQWAGAAHQARMKVVD